MGAWFCAAAVAGGPCLHAANFDAPLPDGERAKLSNVQQIELARADKFYRDNNFERASAEYEIFLQQFPDSPARPYVFFQKARSVNGFESADSALRSYNELLDYYPDRVEYAVPALYFSSECHIQNRDAPNAIKVWTEMATDPDYRKHPLTSHALNRLAGSLMEQEKVEEALKFYRQCAVDFRSSSGDQAFKAIGALVEEYTITRPNEPELRRLYRETGGFGWSPGVIGAEADVAQDRAYWQGIWERVGAKAKTYPVIQIDIKRRLLSYWAGVFRGRFPDWKEFQEQVAAFEKEAA
jgi:TolA-binding protein